MHISKVGLAKAFSILSSLLVLCAVLVLVATSVRARASEEQQEIDAKFLLLDVVRYARGIQGLLDAHPSSVVFKPEAAAEIERIRHAAISEFCLLAPTNERRLREARLEPDGHWFKEFNGLRAEYCPPIQWTGKKEINIQRDLDGG